MATHIIHASSHIPNHHLYPTGSSPLSNTSSRKQQSERDVFSESVYNLIPPESHSVSKPPKYRSIYATLARNEYFTGTRAAATMGPPKVSPNSQKDFLRKHSKEPQLPGPSKFSYPDAETRKPHVPHKDEKPVLPQPTKKNFISSNAVEVINSTARKPIDKSISYRHKSTYGRAPQYLSRRAAELEEEKKAIEIQMQQSLQRDDGLVELDEDERLRILNGLKGNWDKLNSDYQKLSLYTDTVPKILRKVNMEKELKHLEDEIGKFSHKHIYVDLKQFEPQEIY